MEGGVKKKKNRNINWSIFVPIIVAFLTGLFGVAAGVGSWIYTPVKIDSELSKVQLQIEAELTKVQQQSETQIKLQRDKEVAAILARLDDPASYVRTGAALSLGALGGEEIVPVLVGKLRESSMKLAEMETSNTTSSFDIQNEKRFLTAVKQALITIGLPALNPLVELNRDLRFAELRILGSRAYQEAESEEEKRKLWEEIHIDTCANDEVKDAILSILIKVSSVKGLEAESTSIIATENISLAGIDFSYLTLMRINLAGVDLTNADFRYARLTWSDFTNAVLTQAKLDNAIIYGANFEGANLTSANMTNIINFDRARVEGADFKFAIIDSDNLTKYLHEHGANITD